MTRESAEFHTEVQEVVAMVALPPHHGLSRRPPAYVHGSGAHIRATGLAISRCGAHALPRLRARRSEGSHTRVIGLSPPRRYTGAQIGLVLGVQLVTTLIAKPFAGRVSDRMVISAFMLAV